VVPLNPFSLCHASCTPRPFSPSQGIWIAAVLGLASSLLLWYRCGAIFASMGAAPEVVAPAVAYMRARCIASPAILMYYVLSGTFRGFKDTR
jgi:Na+-driven multidrug efflux pump